ncbi:MAG: DeoR family transcriptional regulator [Actinomycetota bacterium]|nr:DeoR family transcriptional regulator [Actinomycetota bacterium]
MLSAERKLEIAKIINQDGRIKTSDLSAMFNVSEMTVLRDLAVLEKEGVLKRVYGGALAFNDSTQEIPTKLRGQLHTRRKMI